MLMCSASAVSCQRQYIRLSNLNKPNATAAGIVTQSSQIDSLDTSLLLEDLKRKYKEAGRPLPISFRELLPWVRAGDQYTHHIHPYPGKLLPHIANFFVRASSLNRLGGQVLDPFCGSGTVALEATLAGSIGIVADANPFALLVTKVKTTPYDVSELLLQARDLRNRITRLRVAPDIAIVNWHLWYSSRVKKGLELILRAITELRDSDEKDFFKVCFAAAARRLSFADPAVSVPVRLKQKSTLSAAANKKIGEHLAWLHSASPMEEFERVVQLNIGRVHAANFFAPSRRQAICAGTDARRLIGNPYCKLAPNSVPLTITSPPYGSAQKYIRATSLALNWLSLCEPTQLADLEGRSIGREHLATRRERPAPEVTRLLSSEFRELLARIRAKNVLRADLTETYFREMGEALCEVARATKHEGHAVIVIGNNTVAGLGVENDTYLTEIMQELGFNLELSLIDRIHSRGLMTARHRTASLISGETILLFRKKADEPR